MAAASRGKYTAEERKRRCAAYNKLCRIIESAEPNSEEFRRTLDAAFAAGFPINYSLPTYGGWTLLHEAVFYTAGMRAGLLQVLIEASAELNVKNRNGNTPLGIASRCYIRYGAPEYLTAINTLLAAGARPELDGHWKENPPDPRRQARRDWLDAYIKTWPERRAARERAADASSAFDYAL